MEQSAEKFAPPPEGFKIVVDGTIQPGDMVWNDSAIRWEAADHKMIRDDVDAYYAVARKW